MIGCVELSRSIVGIARGMGPAIDVDPVTPLDGIEWRSRGRKENLYKVIRRGGTVGISQALADPCSRQFGEPLDCRVGRYHPCYCHMLSHHVQTGHSLA